METIISIGMLAASLAAGIWAGSCFARASLGFLKSLAIQVVMFTTLCAACIWLTNHPVLLACVATGLVSTFSFWIARKTAPDPVTSTSYFGYAPDNGMKVNRTDNPFESKTDASPTGLRAWATPLRRFRAKVALPSRMTPTGVKIRMVAVNEAVPPGKRSDAKLTAVK